MKKNLLNTFAKIFSLFNKRKHIQTGVFHYSTGKKITPISEKMSHQLVNMGRFGQALIVGYK